MNAPVHCPRCAAERGVSIPGRCPHVDPETTLPPEGKLKGFRLVGEDGNAFAIIGRFLRCARAAGWREEDARRVIEVAKSSDYNNLIRVFARYSGRK